MKLFNDRVAPLVIPESPVVDWLEAMRAMLMDPAFSNTWRISAGPACRVVFAFADGLQVTWLGTGNGDEPDRVQVWRSDFSEWYANSPGECPVGDGDWDTSSQTWVIYGVSLGFVRSVVDDAIQEHGLPTLVLPWEDNDDEATDELMDSLDPALPFLEAIGKLDASVVADLSEKLSEAEEYDSYAAPVFAAARLGGVVLPDGWGFQRCVSTSGEDYLSPFSPNVLFMSFASEVSESGSWVVSWDECCGTCAGGTYQMLAEMNNLPLDSPYFVLYGQNAQYAFPPDGTVEYTGYFKSPEEADTICGFAERHDIVVYRSSSDSADVTFTGRS